MITPDCIGKLTRDTRKSLGLTQKNLAMASGTGIRFIIELEQGKPTCQLGKVLKILEMLGIKITLLSEVHTISDLNNKKLKL